MINNKEIYKLQKDVKALQDAPPPDIDLSDYYTKPEVDTKISEMEFPEDWGEVGAKVENILSHNDEYKMIGLFVSGTHDYTKNKSYIGIIANGALNIFEYNLKDNIIKRNVAIINNSNVNICAYDDTIYAISSSPTSILYKIDALTGEVLQEENITPLLPQGISIPNVADLHCNQNGIFVLGLSNSKFINIKVDPDNTIAIKELSLVNPKRTYEYAFTTIAVLINNKIYCTSGSIPKLEVYDIESNTWNSYNYPTAVHPGTCLWPIHSLNEDEVYLLSNNGDISLFKFSVNTEEIVLVNKSERYSLGSNEQHNGTYITYNGINCYSAFSNESSKSCIRHIKVNIDSYVNKVEVRQIKGTTSNINNYTGLEGQLVVNKETKRLHLMDGATNGGTIIPNMEDLSGIDITDKLPPKDYGEYSNIGAINIGLKYPQNYNDGDYIIHQIRKGEFSFIENPDWSDGYDNPTAIKGMQKFLQSGLDFSSHTLTHSQNATALNNPSGIGLIHYASSKTCADMFITAGHEKANIIILEQENLPYEQQQARAANVDLAKYTGKNGQLVVNITNKSLHVMDGTTPGGTELAKKSEAFEKDWGELHMAWADGFIPPGDYDKNKSHVILFDQWGWRYLFEEPKLRNSPPYWHTYSNKAWKVKNSLDFSSCDVSTTIDEQIDSDYPNKFYYDRESIRSAFLNLPYATTPILTEPKKLFGGADNAIEVSNVTGINADMELYSGKEGQIVYNKETKTIHAMDGITAGGKALATKEEVDQVFQSVSSGKGKIETAITDKGGTVSKAGQVATFDELVTAINTIPIGDPDHVCKEDGKQELLDMMISKLPSLEGKLTVDSSLSDFAHYLNMIGEMLFAFKEMFNAIPIDSVAGAIDPVVLEQFQAIMDMNVMEDQHTPFTEIFTAFAIPDVSGNTTPITLSTTIAEKIEVTEEAFGHVLYFRNNTSYMFIMDKMNFELEKDSIGLKKNHILTAEDSNGVKVININMEDFNKITQMEVEI